MHTHGAPAPSFPPEINDLVVWLGPVCKSYKLRAVKLIINGVSKILDMGGPTMCNKRIKMIKCASRYINNGAFSLPNSFFFPFYYIHRLASYFWRSQDHF